MANKSAYMLLWRIVDGAVKDALTAKSTSVKKGEFQKLRTAINKRVVGSVLGFVAVRNKGT